MPRISTHRYGFAVSNTVRLIRGSRARSSTLRLVAVAENSHRVLPTIPPRPHPGRGRRLVADFGQNTHECLLSTGNLRVRHGLGASSAWTPQTAKWTTESATNWHLSVTRFGTYGRGMSTFTYLESSHQTAVATPRARMISGPLALVFVSEFAMLTSFYLLLSVTPLYVVKAGWGARGPGW